MSPTESHELLSDHLAGLGRMTRAVMLQLAEARQAGNKDLALSLREALADLFEERDRKAHALSVLTNSMKGA